MPRIIVLAPCRHARGGISAVLKLYEQSDMWGKYHCRWIATYRDGSYLCKLWFFFKGLAEYLVLLPFYDIVHIHFSLSGSARRKFPFFRLAKWLGKPIVIHLHCGSQIDDIWNNKYQTMFEQCDCGILLSESLKSKIESHIGQSDKLRVVYNPCPKVSGTDCYAKKKQILFSGTLYDGKGYKDLIRAFALIATRCPQWRLVFAGNGDVDKALSLANELGVKEQVEFLGWVSGLVKHKVFCESSALCLPSYAEGFPMAVLDAWAYGLPVITTPVGGIPDVAIDGENMLLFEPGDVNQLAMLLDRLISDDRLRNLLSAESLKMASDGFNLMTITEQIGIIYSSLI